MTTTICNEQPVCLVALAALGINPATLQPKPPSNISDGLTHLGDNNWLVITNKAGAFTLHVLEDASKKEAWDYFNAMKPAGVASVNPRLVVLNDKPPVNN